jgi:hypothetical protein
MYNCNYVVMREIPIYPPLRDMQITVSYTDRGGYVCKMFNNVDELASFFKSNPEIAREFGYVRKKEMPPEPPKKIDDLEEAMKEFLNSNSINRIWNSAGRIKALNLRLVELRANGYVLTKEGQQYVERLKSKK